MPLTLYLISYTWHLEQNMGLLAAGANLSVFCSAASAAQRIDAEPEYVIILIWQSAWGTKNVLEAFASFTVFADTSFHCRNGAKKRKKSASKCFRMAKNVQNGVICTKCRKMYKMAKNMSWSQALCHRQPFWLLFDGSFIQHMTF